MPTDPAQHSLFALPPRAIAAAPQPAEVHALAERIPPTVRFGTMSWSYPGWTGIVYGANVTPKDLADHGLTAYAKHPLFRAVEIDRTYYEPLRDTALRSYAEQTPDDFRFVVKAHEACTLRQFPKHARYGKRRGETNDRYLDPAYAADACVAPMVQGLGSKAAALLFPFPPQDVAEKAEAFAARLHDFLRRLPAGVTYAVELRNKHLFTADYVAALADVGAVHCHNAWPGMPPVLAQLKRTPPPARRLLLVRWLMREGDAYEKAAERYAPFDKLVEEDTPNRAVIARASSGAAAHGVPAIVLVDNKAEGCAPESIVRLAREIDAAKVATDGED
jgi:uncharacterized protein YecE (DUF72 family)